MSSRYPWPPPDLVDWCAEVDQDKSPEWLLKDLIPMDAAVLISGRAKITYKTWLTFAVAQALSTGRPISLLEPTITSGVPGAIFELEGPRKQVRRRWAFLESGNSVVVPRGKIIFAHRYPILLTQPFWLERICELVKARDLKFVVIDTLAKSMAGDENNVKDISETMRAIDAIRSAGTGTTVFYLHHLRKPPQDRGMPEDIDDELRGSTALSGFYDVHMALRQQQNSKDLLLKVRASNAEETWFKIFWDISSTGGYASLKMERYDPTEAPSADVLMECLNKLEEGVAYSFKTLADIWQLPGEVVAQIRDSLLANGALGRTSRGVRRIM